MELWPSIDPMALAMVLWPSKRVYDKQQEIVYSVEYNRETYVVAGNGLGKDWITAMICLNLFLRCIKAGLTCRIVNTSVAEHQLKVVWGEIGRFITDSVTPLMDSEGGPLRVNYMEIRRASEAGVKNPLNYLAGRVSEGEEGLSGHHADVTLFVADEASGVSDAAYRAAQGWAKRMLFIGNPFACDNFFKRGVEAGDLLMPDS